MGAVAFTHGVTGPSLDVAFAQLTDAARHQFGQGGYSGTVAEKSRVALLDRPKLPRNVPLRAWVDAVLNWDGDRDDLPALSWSVRDGGGRPVHDEVPMPAELAPVLDRHWRAVNDKWGPAGAIDDGPSINMGERRWAIFGWASS